MKQYIEMLQHIRKNGEEREDRTGTGTVGVFGYQNRYDLLEGFPLVTTKKVSLRLVFEELMWFLRGETNIEQLLEKNVSIWNEDAYRWHLQKNPSSELTMEDFLQRIREGDRELGDLGPVYGKQWRTWESAGCVVNQIEQVLASLRKDPYGRRHIVTAWNPGELPEMALPPCHVLFQFYIDHKGRLSCQLYQRSADVFLGVPFNIASYALLVHLMARELGREPGEFIHVFGDLHIYKDHVEPVELQCSREPMKLPKLTIRGDASMYDVTWEDIELSGYEPWPAIPAKVSVGRPTKEDDERE